MYLNCKVDRWKSYTLGIWLGWRAHVLIRDKHTWNAKSSTHHWLIYLNPPHPTQEHCKHYSWHSMIMCILSGPWFQSRYSFWSTGEVLGPKNLYPLYTSQEATWRTRHGTTDWFKLGKGVCQGCILSLCLFNLYVEYIMWNAWLDEAQAGIKITGRHITNIREADDTTLTAESEEEPKEPPDEGERAKWKSWFKTQHSKN